MGRMKDLLITVYGGGDEAVAAAEKLAGIGRWIPVSERLPDEEQEVLAYWPPEDQQCGRWMSVAWVFEDDKWKDMEMELKSPTHWMPLPEPPEVK